MEIQKVNVIQENTWGRTGMTTLEIELHEKYDKILADKFRNYTLCEFLESFPSPKEN